MVRWPTGEADDKQQFEKPYRDAMLCGSFHLVDLSIGWNLPSSAFCKPGFVDSWYSSPSSIPIIHMLDLFMVSQISWTFCFMTFLVLVFSLTVESISSISVWNLENRFSGWYGGDLIPAGHEEAKRGRQALRDAGYEFDICFTSVQKRAIWTLWTVLDAFDQMWLPVVRTWCLNERHYGGLTALNKAETAAKHGDAQVKIWRQSYDVPPPLMEPDHPFYSNISKDRRNCPPDQGGEKSPDCNPRHRGIVKRLQSLSEEAIMELNLPTGIPIELEKNLKPIKPMQFLGDEETVRKAMEAVVAQGKAKK
ncbi:hypothetical protein STEG23_019353 [Scotinomys teguina]